MALDPRRPKNVGSSECASLLSLALDEGDLNYRRETRFQLWARKSGLVPHDDDDTNERADIGRAVEGAILELTAQRLGRQFVRGVFYEHRRVKGMAASFDGFLLDASAPLARAAPLEAKNVDRSVWLRWSEEPDPLVRRWDRKSDSWVPAERVPRVPYLLQVQHQIAVMATWDENLDKNAGRDPRGLQPGYLSALVGGNQLVPYRVDPAPALIDKLEREVEAFWREVREKTPPPIDWFLDAETIGEIYRQVDPALTRDLTGDQTAHTLAWRVHRLGKQIKALDRRREAAHAQLLSIVKDAATAYLDGGYKATSWTVKDHVIPATTRSGYRAMRVYKKKR